MFHKFPSLVLASGSPRRRQLLADAGFNVRFLHPNIEESFPENIPLHQVAEFLAEKKSLSICKNLAHNEVLITADTIVVYNSEVLNKPLDEADAQNMLQKLSGQSHIVYTGVCIRNAEKTCVFTEESKVFFKELSPEFISAYIQTGSPMDKAGAYGIQDMMGYFGVRRIEGCYYNIMGFPLAAFYEKIKTF
jgi:septum formation protein